MKQIEVSDKCYERIMQIRATSLSTKIEEISKVTSSFLVAFNDEDIKKFSQAGIKASKLLNEYSELLLLLKL